MSDAFADAGRLRQELDSVWKMHDVLKRENADLRAQLEAARKDAERYRWLRDEWHVASVYGHEYIKHGWRGETDKMKEMLEVAIDAAIAQGRGGK